MTDITTFDVVLVGKHGIPGCELTLKDDDTYHMVAYLKAAEPAPEPIYCTAVPCLV